MSDWQNRKIYLKGRFSAQVCISFLEDGLKAIWLALLCISAQQQTWVHQQIWLSIYTPDFPKVLVLILMPVKIFILYLF